MEWLLVGLGLVILLLAGDALVRGAVNVSLRIGIPALIVSLTIVAFGTSAPELLISIEAALKNAPGIALGNVVGSNIANVLLVLGIPALLAPIQTSHCNSRRNYVLMIAATVLFIGVASAGFFTFTSGLILLAGLTIALGSAFYQARCHRKAEAACAMEDEEEVEGADPDMPWWRIFVFLILGLIGLPLGADLMVDNAEVIARRYGVSDTVIGLTLIALGTSLPELATTVMAALRRQADVALGNVIGSNLFNLLAIIGVTSLIHPIRVDPDFFEFDFWVMLASSLLLIPFVFLRQDLTRIWGVVFTALYLIYIAVTLT
ncbi:calcium/sodium antiporter [Shimia sp. R9_2]|uniref:calcium/sodium antiporter n=1 Tax=unclassified Shimia TaxID=2630038 RepID=UPI001ADA23A1|nr:MULTISPECIES: calcium/sodium antiporter [unclassified Shimia]MBO9398934.1 calcium/sodium antiporter [Shimia sp. R9_2]MBO9402989.1 calcium/sodium antiporter [Shimia sp. R9_3]